MKHIRLWIRRLLRSPNTRGLAKLILDALVLLILGWLLYETISCPASVHFLPIKLTQLLIAAVASGALLLATLDRTKAGARSVDRLAVVVHILERAFIARLART